MICVDVSLRPGTIASESFVSALATKSATQTLRAEMYIYYSIRIFALLVFGFIHVLTAPECPDRRERDRLEPKENHPKAMIETENGAVDRR